MYRTAKKQNFCFFSHFAVQYLFASQLIKGSVKAFFQSWAKYKKTKNKIQKIFYFILIRCKTTLFKQWTAIQIFFRKAKNTK